MIELITLPLLPLLALGAALWFGLMRRPEGRAAGLVVALIAAAAIGMATFAPFRALEMRQLLVQGNSLLVLEAGSRPALLLFGGLWLIAGLLARRRADGRGHTALLMTLSGTLTLALAQGEALIYTSLLVTGYGLYALMAADAQGGWRRAGRALIVLLVISDLLIFEALVHSAAHEGYGIPPSLVPLVLIALLLRGGIPPAHVWLPLALSSVNARVAILLLAVPTGAALFAAIKLLPEGVGGASGIITAIALTGAAWSLVAGIAQRRGPATVGYALAASAAALLAAFPAAAAASMSLAWTALAVLASVSTLPLVSLQHRGRVRNTTIAITLIVHGLAVGQTATLAASGLAAALVAVAATTLLTISAQRVPSATRSEESREAGALALALAGLAIVGLLLAWAAVPPQLASAWVAPAGITLGLLLHRFAAGAALPRIAPGDLLVPIESIGCWSLQRLRGLCEPGLSRIRDGARELIIAAWSSKAWAARMEKLELRLRSWPATSLLVLLLALIVALLLAG